MRSPPTGASSTLRRPAPDVEQYLERFMEGADLYAQTSGTKPERVDTIAAICLRESLAGAALKPPGPDGTGDWTARRRGWVARPGVQVVPDSPEERRRLATLGWSLPKRRGQVLPGPYAIPADGLGWGRGLFQLDVLGDQANLIAPAPWPVERQAFAACAQLHLARIQLSAFAAHPLFERAVMARYNAPIERVLAGLEAGNPDIGTTHGDYGKDVLARREGLRRKYPGRFQAPGTEEMT